MNKLLLLTTLVFPSVALAGSVDIVAGSTPASVPSAVLQGLNGDSYISNHSDKEFLQVQAFSPKQYPSAQTVSDVNDSIFLDKDNEFTWKLDCLSSVHPMASCKVAAGKTNVGKYVDDKRKGKGPFGLPKVDKAPLAGYVADKPADMRYGDFPPPPVDLNDKKAVQELTLTTLTRTVRVTGKPEEVNAILAKDKELSVIKEEPQPVKKGAFIKNPMVEDEVKPVAPKDDFDSKLAALKADLDAHMAEYKARVEADKAAKAKEAEKAEKTEKAEVKTEPIELVKSDSTLKTETLVPVAAPKVQKAPAAEKKEVVTTVEEPVVAAEPSKTQVKPVKGASKAKAKKQDKSKVSLKNQFAKAKKPALGPSVSAKPDVSKEAAEPVVTVETQPKAVEKVEKAEQVKQVEKVKQKPAAEIAPKEPVAVTETAEKESAVKKEKAAPSKILIQKKVEQPAVKAEKDTVKRPSLDINEQLYIALAKVLGGKEIDERLEGLRELGYIANQDTTVHPKIANALYAFLSERASFARSAELVSVPKTDIEQALAVLSRLDLGGEKISLKNLDFSGVKLSDLSFVGADFSDSGFVGAEIMGVDFSGASFVGADFSKAHLLDVNMEGADLEAAYFADAFLKNVNFKRANLSCAVFKLAKIMSCDFSEAKLTSVWFAESRVMGSSFLKADLTRSDFSKAFVINNNFTASVMDNVNFIGSQNRGNDFAFADFKEVFLKSVDLRTDKGITVDMMLSSVFDKDTKAPMDISAAFEAILPQEQEQCTYTENSCKERLAPVAKNYTELTNVSVKVLTSSKANMWQRNWAACNIGCVMQVNKELGAKGISALASMIKRERPWPAQSNRQANAVDLPSDVASALYVIGHRPASLKGMSIDLTNTDLHKVDFYGYDMTGVDFAGSNLIGASTMNSKGLPDNTTSMIAPSK